MNERVPFHIPVVGKEEEDAVLEVLRSGWLTTGKKVKEFEERFAEFVEAKHAIAVSSATAGLFLSLKAINKSDNPAKRIPNDLVQTTPYTFIATTEVIEWCGLRPEFKDVEENTYNINPDHLHYPGVKGEGVVIPVHIAGVKCDMEKIYKYLWNGSVQDNNFTIIEDCAHYFPSKFDGRSLSAVYSFYATKSISTGEGGMIVTNDDKFASHIRVILNHGILQSSFDRYTSAKNKWYYEVQELGYKFNMMDLSAALGIVQLKKAYILNEARKRIAKKYIENLGKLDFVITPIDRPDNTWHLFIMRLKLDKLAIDRNQFIDELTKANIGVSVHYIPLHMMPYYKNKTPYSVQHFPIAEKLYESSMSLPIYPGMSDEEFETTIAAIKQIGEKYHR
jgi:dTDP-4-amino-4,6-dideoxygalactose transaminase